MTRKSSENMAHICDQLIIKYIMQCISAIVILYHFLIHKAEKRKKVVILTDVIKKDFLTTSVQRGSMEVKLFNNHSFTENSSSERQKEKSLRFFFCKIKKKVRIAKRLYE